MKTVDGNGKLYGLVDGAQYPEALAIWVLEFSPEVRSLFEGLPEEEAGNAAPILFEIDDADSEWVRHIDQMDRYRPCFTVMRSALGIDELKIHIQRFLFADIGEGMQVLLRWFDPRSLPSIVGVAGQAVIVELTRPIATWMYRGGSSEWRYIAIDERLRIEDARQFSLSLSQRQLDTLEKHDEPHALMSELSDLGLIDANQPYAIRYRDLLHRYGRAIQWGLALRADLHAFCVASYQYGEAFDRQGEIRSAIRSAVAGEASLLQEFELVPSYVWRDLMRDFEKRAKSIDEQDAEK
ncbi:hypothetical protein BBJ41_23315 [Burkholderia stabilis]|uniref:DUF4123 domain-containing protein n=1 Tax=Burkholderia stabilis TaxID=95485 RepID=UPI000851E4FF|nr:DUF4123 domain-containing protein [Burkholderia stabilis]AOR72241.1 hypothetical protein BBJ41_23315 [Burkholderia stabilis]HDR9491169.1 DUF4123 domain-containing protein [Burkholderia stabilis]HDR9496644.1 DUF4123 domain-containing protein [Burkholderia stabilis]HDR9525765.1 DUF4123 domain-containing protein [Burkholderia stabilis]HDR9533170.1 DUF4123 domain-containing protein [Burkholderia stabilis]